MVPCRGRGRLVGSKGPLYLMRAPVPEVKRSTFTSRGYMTGYTINPRIGNTSTRFGRPCIYLRLRGLVGRQKRAQHAACQHKVHWRCMRTLCRKGREELSYRGLQRCLCISLGITCLEKVRPEPTLGGSAAFSVVADDEPVLDSKPNTSSRQWSTRSASNPPDPMFFGLARVPGVPCRFMEPRFREPLDSGTCSMKPLLEEALLSTLSWLLSR